LLVRFCGVRGSVPIQYNGKNAVLIWMPSLQKSVVPASINVSIIDCAGVRFIFYFGDGNNLVLQPLIIPHCIMNWPGAVDMHVQSLSQKEKK
jgi:hypothetical protein